MAQHSNALATALPSLGRRGAMGFEQTNQNHPLQDAFDLFGNQLIAYYPRLVHITRSTPAAMMLSQALYWSRIIHLNKHRGGWFYKTHKQWQAETGLTRSELDTARAILRNLGVLQELRKGVPAKLWYKLDLDQIGRLMMPAEYVKWDWSSERLMNLVLGKPFIFYRRLVDIAGSLTAATLLSKIVLEERRQVKLGSPFGWRRSSQIQLRRSCALTRHELYSAKDKLKRNGLIVTRVKGSPPVSELQVNSERLLARLLCEFSQSAKPKPASDTISDTKSETVNHRSAPDNFISGNESSSFPDKTATSLQKELFVHDVEGNKQPKTADLSICPDSCNLETRIPANWSAGKRTISLQESGQIIYIEKTTKTKTTPPIAEIIATEAINAQSCNQENRRGSFFEGEIKPQLLIWPSILNAEERPYALKMLQQLANQELAQLMLDEIGGQIRGGRAISKPLGYLARCIERQQAGQYVPSAALKEKEYRNRQLQRLKDQPNSEQAHKLQQQKDELRAERSRQIARDTIAQWRKNRQAGNK